ILGVFQFANRLEAACGVLAKRTMPVVARPNRWTGFALGVCFCTKRRRVFSVKPPPGRVGSPLGLLTANRWAVFKQDFEVLRGVRFDPGWTVPDKGLA